MIRSRLTPIVYGGPSLSEVSLDLRNRLEIRPPVKRGDILTLMSGTEKQRPVLILDGLFGASLAVTPAECRDAINQGWPLIGASSMGALRAADLWSVGMIGIGNIFLLYRLGVLVSDADVAVAYDSETYEELTVSMVHLRSVLKEMEAQGAIDSLFSRKVILKSRGIPWFERYSELILKIMKDLKANEDQCEVFSSLIRDHRFHPKKVDAKTAIHTLLADRWVFPC